MPNSKIELFEKLLLSEEGLLIKLRLGKGLDRVKYDSICYLLEELAAEWKGIDTIPKKAAELFVDLYPAMDATSYQYKNDEAIIIKEAADKLISLIRDCCI